MNTKDTENTNKNVDFTKPFQIIFGGSNYTVSTSNCYEGFCIVTPNDRQEVYTYAKRTVENHISTGFWKIIPLTNESTEVVGNSQDDAMKKLEDYIRAIHKNVLDEPIKHVPEGCSWCECPDCKEAFAQEAEGCFDCDSTPDTCDCGAYIETPVEYQETLLDAIKSFTQNTSATVFMVDGEYEVYCLGLDSPFKAATDAEMWKLIEAVEMLEGAM